MAKGCLALSLVILVEAVFCLSASSVWAKVPDTLWTRAYGGEWTDHGQCIRQTSDGGFVIAGYSDSFSPGVADYNFYLIKTDVNGDSVWQRVYGGTGDDRAQCVRQSRDGGYILAGYTTSFGQGGADVYLVKTDANGILIWTRTYGGSGHDEAQSVWQTTDDGFIVAGYTASFGSGGYDVYLIRTDANGDTTGGGWARTYGGPEDDCAYSAQQTLDGGYIVAGRTRSFGAGIDDVYLTKTDAAGAATWTRTYGGTGDDQGFSVQQTLPDSGYIITGFTALSDISMHDIYLVRTKANGDTLWTRSFGGQRYDQGNSVQQTSDGGYVIGGYSDSFGEDLDDYDLYLLRTGRNGRLRWSRTFGWPDYDDRGEHAQQTADGGYVIVGHTPAVTPPWGQVYLVRLERDSRIWHVPGDAATIQDAITAGAPGDTVLVSDGYYYESVSMKSGVVLVSEGGPTSTTIDGSPGGRAITCVNVDTTAAINGFTLTGGYAGSGGAIYCVNSSPSIAFNVIRGNTGATKGGGIYCGSNSSPRIHHDTVVDNRSPQGGGIYVENSTVEIHNTIVVGDSAYGIYCGNGGVCNLGCNDVWSNGRGDYYGCSPAPSDTSCDPCFCKADSAVGPDSASTLMLCSPVLKRPGCGQTGALGEGCSGAGVPTPSNEGAAIIAHGAFPSPAKGAVIIWYNLNVPCRVEIEVYEVSGRAIYRHEYDGLEAGTHYFNWDGVNVSGDNVASGTYYYRIDAGGKDAEGSVTIVR
jgi:hypothetical protein